MSSFWDSWMTNNNEETPFSELLQNIPLFKDLSKKQISEVSKLLYERNYTADETVFAKGDPATALYVIKSGQIQILVDEGKETGELANLSDGEFFGERAVGDDLSRTATAKTRENSVLLVLFRQELLELIQRDRKLGNKVLIRLIEVLGDRLESANNMIQKLISESGEGDPRLD